MQPVLIYFEEDIKENALEIVLLQSKPPEAKPWQLRLGTARAVTAEEMWSAGGAVILRQPSLSNQEK